jgi:hypothetical protein
VSNVTVQIVRGFALKLRATHSKNRLASFSGAFLYTSSKVVKVLGSTVLYQQEAASEVITLCRLACQEEQKIRSPQTSVSPIEKKPLDLSRDLGLLLKVTIPNVPSQLETFYT